MICQSLLIAEEARSNLSDILWDKENLEYRQGLQRLVQERKAAYVASQPAHLRLEAQRLVDEITSDPAWWNARIPSRIRAPVVLAIALLQWGLRYVPHRVKLNLYAGLCLRKITTPAHMSSLVVIKVGIIASNLQPCCACIDKCLCATGGPRRVTPGADQQLMHLFFTPF